MDPGRFGGLFEAVGLVSGSEILGDRLITRMISRPSERNLVSENMHAKQVLAISSNEYACESDRETHLHLVMS